MCARRSHCALHDPAAAAALALALAGNTTLESLSIAGNSIRGGAAVRIAAGLAGNSHLRHLDVAANPIGADGAAALLAPLLSNPTLHSVGVMRCNLGEPVPASGRASQPLSTSAVQPPAKGGMVSPRGLRAAHAGHALAPEVPASAAPLFTQVAGFIAAATTDSARVSAAPGQQVWTREAQAGRVDPRVIPGFTRRVPSASVGARVLCSARFEALWESVDLAAASQVWLLDLAAAAARALWLSPEQCAAMVAGMLRHHEGPHVDAVATAVRCLFICMHDMHWCCIVRAGAWVACCAVGVWHSRKDDGGTCIPDWLALHSWGAVLRLLGSPQRMRATRGGVGVAPPCRSMAADGWTGRARAGTDQHGSHLSRWPVVTPQ